MKHRIALKEKKDIAEGTMEFIFEKPQGFEFKAGQNVDMTLINPPETDAEGNTRAFSIVAAPHEDYFANATRMRDTAFKRVLKNLKPGDNVEITDAMGSFTLHQNQARPAIFLVGGIGITPFMSMLKDAAYKKLPHKIYLFYSNRRPEDAAFLNEITELTKTNPNFVFIPTMTEVEKSTQKWEGETGYITIDMINKHVPDRNNAVYYTAGPQTMVAAMRKLLSNAGVSDDDIKTEEFAGY